MESFGKDNSGFSNPLKFRLKTKTLVDGGNPEETLRIRSLLGRTQLATRILSVGNDPVLISCNF
jgi:hypothetical protein